VFQFFDPSAMFDLLAQSTPKVEPPKVTGLPKVAPIGTAILVMGMSVMFLMSAWGLAMAALHKPTKIMLIGKDFLMLYLFVWLGWSLRDAGFNTGNLFTSILAGAITGFMSLIMTVFGFR